MQVPDIVTTIKDFVPHLTVGTLLACVIYVIKTTSKIAKKASEFDTQWQEMRAGFLKLTTNEMPHIQDATERTAAAVEKLVDAIQEQAITSAKILAVLETQNR